MAIRPVIKKIIPVPSPRFHEKYRMRDLPQVFADEHTLILTYKGVPKGITGGCFDPTIMLQVLDYEHFDFASAKSRSSQGTAKVTLKKHARKWNISIKFQSAQFEVTVLQFRCYAFLEDNDFEAEDVEMEPSVLIEKRAYFERQLDDDIHYPVWDKLLKSGRTRSQLWLQIQEKYLFRYRRFLRVECDWGGTGIWGISFPGSYGTNPNYDYGCFDLPKSLVSRFDKWTRYYSSMNPEKTFDEQGFDWKWFHSEGEYLTAKLARYVDPLTYIEYHPFVPIPHERWDG